MKDTKGKRDTGCSLNIVCIAFQTFFSELCRAQSLQFISKSLKENTIQLKEGDHSYLKLDGAVDNQATLITLMLTNNRRHITTGTLPIYPVVLN